MAALAAEATAWPAGERWTVSLKFEPPIAHVRCATLAAARRLVRVCHASGWRETGCNLADVPTVAVRSTGAALDCPLGEVARDGALHTMAFARGGVVAPMTTESGGAEGRSGTRLTFTPDSLREAEAGRTLACLQFETEEYLFDDDLRRSVLKVLSKRGNACAFVGALDAATRCGDAARVLRGSRS